MSDEKDDIQELSKGTLGSYVKKAVSDIKDEQAEAELVESAASETLKAVSRSFDDPKTKVDYITSMLGTMHGMKKEDLTKWFDQSMALIGKETSGLPAAANAAANRASISMKEDVEEMFAGEELSEEFKANATTLFEAAVTAKAMVRIAELEEEFETQFEAQLEEHVNAIAEEVETNLDAYLSHAVDVWMEENSVAIESALRNEIAEDFIDGMKKLFSEHYINVPEDKVEVVESLAAKVEELETALDEAIIEKSKLRDIVLEAKRNEVLADLAENITLTQTDKFLALAEGVSFDGDIEAYEAKLTVVKEQYFKPKKVTSNINEETFEGDELTETVNVDPAVSQYSAFISRQNRK